MESKNILSNLVDYVRLHKKSYLNTTMDIVVFALTKLLKKKISKNYIVNQQSLDASGFNNYWSKLLSDVVNDLNDKQADILVKKFGLNKDAYLFESVQNESTNNDGVGDLVNQITELYQDKNNFIILENGSQLARFECNLPTLNISLLFHAKNTESFPMFISSIEQFIKYRLSDFDIESLYYQYVKHYANADESDLVLAKTLGKNIE